jgi:hypothetical protein
VCVRVVSVCVILCNTQIKKMTYLLIPSARNDNSYIESYSQAVPNYLSV